MRERLCSGQDFYAFFFSSLLLLLIFVVGREEVWELVECLVASLLSCWFLCGKVRSWDEGWGGMEVKWIGWYAAN